MTLRTAILTVGLFIASFGRAAAQKVTVEFDETVDFTKFKTFAVREGQMNARNPALNSELAKKRVQSQIEKGLTEKGLTPAAPGTPADLNVFFTFGSARRVGTETYPAGWRGLGTRVVREAYAEGTLVIDLRNPATRSLVWRGIATEDEKDPVKLSEKLDDMAKKAVSKYPPKK